MFYQVPITAAEGGGIEPLLPPEAGFLVIYYGPDYCVLESQYLYEIEFTGGLPDFVKRLPPDLNSLLRSATVYPPARALAVEAIERRGALSAADLVDELQLQLTTHLEAQRTAGYVLLRAVGDQLGYMRRGDYYWVLGAPSSCRNCRPEHYVRWVSSDYQIYGGPTVRLRVRRGYVALLRATSVR